MWRALPFGTEHQDLEPVPEFVAQYLARHLSKNRIEHSGTCDVSCIGWLALHRPAWFQIPSMNLKADLQCYCDVICLSPEALIYRDLVLRQSNVPNTQSLIGPGQVKFFDNASFVADMSSQLFGMGWVTLYMPDQIKVQPTSYGFGILFSSSFTTAIVGTKLASVSKSPGRKPRLKSDLARPIKAKHVPRNEPRHEPRHEPRNEPRNEPRPEPPPKPDPPAKPAEPVKENPTFQDGLPTGDPVRLQAFLEYDLARIELYELTPLLFAYAYLAMNEKNGKRFYLAHIDVDQLELEATNNYFYWSTLVYTSWQKTLLHFNSVNIAELARALEMDRGLLFQPWLLNQVIAALKLS